MQPGTRLGHFEIVSKLGQGGMGEVYLAHDTLLERKVALKVLSGHLVGDVEGLKRLQREARSLAALDHPNIVPVYSFESDEDVHFLTMAYIDGQTLARLLPAGGFPLRELLELAIPLADALRAAHRRGIVHRDLKPANVMIDRDGRPRVLDFGLAKKSAWARGEASVLTTLSATEHVSEAGTILGTYPYMSPEQAEGKTVDARSDLFSFGVMLYEMACGARPFHGGTAISLISSILRDEPRPICEVKPDLPRRLDVVISRCLEKDPAARYPTAEALRSDLEALRPGTASASPASQTSKAAVSLAAAQTGRVSRASFTRRTGLWLAAVVVVLGATGIGVWSPWRRGGAGPRTLAVLPFENTLKDPEGAYLCEGVAESLIRQLAGLPSIRVRPLGAALSLKGQGLDPIEAGKKLGADIVLAGKLEREGDRLRIKVELLDVGARSSLWSNSYDRPAKDLLGVQEEIASAMLAAGLKTRLTAEQQRDLIRRPTIDGEAYDLYLQARYLTRRSTEDDLLRAIDLLRRATVRDPRYAQAYLMLGGVYEVLAIDGYQRPTDAWALASRYIRQGLALDPNLPDAFAVRHGMAFFFDWDWEGAERERKAAMQSPIGECDPDLFRSFSISLVALARPEEALAMARRSRELDPLSIGLTMLEADYLTRVGRLDEAIALYQRAIKVEPDNPEQYFGLAEALFEQKRFDEAIEARKRAHTVAGDKEMVARFAAARGEKGYREADRAWVSSQLVLLQARSTWGYVSPLDFARAYAQLGEKEKAFEYLEKAFTDHSPGLVFLNVDRAWDGVRRDPRFQAVVKKVGLPQAS